jgi:hypothetical protein
VFVGQAERDPAVPTHGHVGDKSSIFTCQFRPIHLPQIDPTTFDDGHEQVPNVFNSNDHINTKKESNYKVLPAQRSITAIYALNPVEPVTL